MEESIRSLVNLYRPFLHPPTTTPVTTSHTAPFISNNIRRLSSLEDGFSSNSWLTSGRREYDMSEVTGWAWVRTTVSAEIVEYLTRNYQLTEKVRTCDNKIRCIIGILSLKRMRHPFNPLYYRYLPPDSRRLLQLCELQLQLDIHGYPRTEI